MFTSTGFPIMDERKTKAYIINYNRLELMRNLADWLYINGNCEPIIVDNNSDYQPLLDYYDNECPYTIYRMPENYGYKVVWEVLFPTIGFPSYQRYIVTDSDLDLSNVPKDFLYYLNLGLDIYKNVDKCGLSLEINDLPETDMAKNVKRWEAQFWSNRLDGMFFYSMVDTTLALYRENVQAHSLNAIRTDRPYTAKHVPWYYTSLDDLTEDEKYYFSTAKTSTHWTEQIKGGQ